MTDAWTILTDVSTLDDGDAWEHLNAQGGDGPGGEIEILVEAIRSADVLTMLSASCTTQPLIADILTVASASVHTTTNTADCTSANEASI